jgi:peroxiredoxin
MAAPVDANALPSAATIVSGRIGATLLCCYLFAVALRIDGCYRADTQPRDELPAAGPRVGARFPDFELPELGGTRIGTATLAGAPALLLFVPSLDWSPPTKARLLDLAEALAGRRDVRVAVVTTEAQTTPRALTFVRERRTPFTFVIDDGGLVDRLGLRLDAPDGSPTALPATFVLDRDGVVRLRDVRRDPRTWLDPGRVLEALAATSTN